jgi:hypothetical protein
MPQKHFFLSGGQSNIYLFFNFLGLDFFPINS